MSWRPNMISLPRLFDCQVVCHSDSNCAAQTHWLQQILKTEFHVHHVYSNQCSSKVLWKCCTTEDSSNSHANSGREPFSSTTPLGKRSSLPLRSFKNGLVHCNQAEYQIKEGNLWFRHVETHIFSYLKSVEIHGRLLLNTYLPT